MTIQLTDPIQANYYINNVIPVFLHKTEDGQYFQWSTTKKKYLRTFGVNEKLLIKLDTNSVAQEHIHTYLVTLSNGDVIQQELKADLQDTAEIKKVS